jgi:hypothetical protein
MKSDNIDQLIANTILNSLDTLPALGKVEAKQVRVNGYLIADYARIKLGCMYDVVEATDNAVLDDAFSNLVEGLRDDDTFVDAHCAALRLGMAIMNEVRLTSEARIKDLVVSAVNRKRGF